MKKITKEQLKEADYTFVDMLGELERWENLYERIYYDPKNEVIAFRHPREFKQCVKGL